MIFDLQLLCQERKMQQSVPLRLRRLEGRFSLIDRLVLNRGKNGACKL